MNYRYQRPHPLLSEYVRTVLILENVAHPHTARLPLFTNGMASLFCRTERTQDGTENVAQLLLGGTLPPECWETSEGTTIVAFFFQPFALTCLFNISAAKLTQGPVDLRSWNAHQANALTTQLSYAETGAQKTEALEHLLLHRLQQQKRECEIIRYATDQLLCDPGTEALPALLEQLGLTERTFQRLFKKYVGVTPSQYRRICQFQHSFDQLRAKKFGTLADVAYDNGFADQSHFIRSFKEFTDTTPNSYLRSGLNKKER